jgi:hypothetical protein
VRLQAGALSDVQVEQSGGRTDKDGQFVLAVDNARDDPDDPFDRAHAASNRVAIDVSVPRCKRVWVAELVADPLRDAVKSPLIIRICLVFGRLPRRGDPPDRAGA